MKTPALLRATVLLGSLAVSGFLAAAVGFVYGQIQMADERRVALARTAEMNAPRSATYFKTVDEEGRVRYTTCNGRGWCVTDSVPLDPDKEWGPIQSDTGSP